MTRRVHLGRPAGNVANVAAQLMEGEKRVADVYRMGEEARREMEKMLVLERINRRQKALRRSWYQLSRAEVGAELVAIGQELLAAAPHFLPRSFDSGGELVGRNGVEVSRSGQHGCEASWSVHHDGAASATKGGELARLARQALSELERLLREFSQDAHQA